ncbi:MAG: dephospho-CoA kinase [Synergistaceae bacterium]|nr:dephospho-CoA kinase [Synergistaceae bacterium]
MTGADELKDPGHFSAKAAAMAVTAITGDIGAGKSAFAGMLAGILECPLLDADRTAKSLWLRDDVRNIAVSRWGNGILDASGHVALKEVSRRIFASKEDHAFCNSLIHPLVMSELCGCVKNLPCAVIEIPLLPEAGRPQWIDTVIYVEACYSVRAGRCKLRGWDDGELLRREKFLLPRDLRLSASDYIIRNEGSLSELESQAVRLSQEKITHDNNKRSP